FMEICQLTRAQLVKDASRLFFRKFYLLLSLGVRQRPERGSREFRAERQHLVAGNQAVAPKQRHEPRQTGCRKRVLGQGVRTKAQRRNVDQAAHIGASRLRMTGHRRRAAIHSLRLRRMASPSSVANFGWWAVSPVTGITWKVLLQDDLGWRVKRNL